MDVVFHWKRCPSSPGSATCIYMAHALQTVNKADNQSLYIQAWVVPDVKCRVAVESLDLSTVLINPEFLSHPAESCYNRQGR
jgi:hypothetical protein